MAHVLYGIFVYLAIVVFGVLAVSLVVGGVIDLLMRWRRRVSEDGDEWPYVSAPQCRTCGYNLRASPERCPECGTPVDPVEGMVVRYLMKLRGRQKD